MRVQAELKPLPYSFIKTFSQYLNARCWDTGEKTVNNYLTYVNPG
jgi:hypothetical protein